MSQQNTPLTLANLSNISPSVSTPTYSRPELSAGLLHVGVGNFHRAHLGIYLHRLFELGVDQDWAIVGAGVRKPDKGMRNKLASQDWLTTVVELDPKGLTATVSGSMIDFAEVDAQTLIDSMSQPEIRIVSLTVTEGGYYIDAKTNVFDENHPDIVADVQSPGSPKTVFGIIVEALRRRKEAGLAMFTVMSCDNLPNNGDAAKQAVLGISKAHIDNTTDWIEQHVNFPNSMVDCITPATTTREIDIVQNEFGIKDSAPVVCEPFRQWVLEDKFSSGRPALEKVGVEFTDDVAPYELMKLRILNGGHASIAYPAALLDIHFVHDAMQHAGIDRFLDCLEYNEIIPTVPSIAGVSFDEYYANVKTRFSNEVIGDTIPRLCYDGANRQPKFIVPTIEARLESGHAIDGLALESALWCRYCYGTTDSGAEIPPNDPDWSRFNAQAKLAQSEPEKWLEMTDVYGATGSNAIFKEAFTRYLDLVWSKGTEKTMSEYCDSVTVVNKAN